MKITWNVLFAMALLALNGLMAQDTTVTWHNTLNETVDREAAPFYRLGWEENGKWYVEEHYSFGPIYETGQYTDSTCAVKSGTFKTYTKQGVKLSEINYKHNDRIGPYTTWYESGAVNIQGQYGEAVEPEESDTDDYWNSQKASELLGSEEEEGVKIGRWEYYDSKGQLRAAEEYDNEGYKTSSRYWKSDGSTGHQGVTERSAYYPGSDKALIKFLGENIEFPEEDKIKGSSGEVLVSFLVNVDGNVTDFRIERSESPTMDAECLRVLSIMPKWKPAKRHNRNVDMRYFLPIRFTSLTRRGQKELMEKVHQEHDGKLYWAQ